MKVNSINIFVQGVRVNETVKRFRGQREMISKINGKLFADMIIQGTKFIK